MTESIDWDALLAEQIAYYKARVPEYDDWWLRAGNYDLGAASNTAWSAEIARLDEVLRAFNPVGDVLELAAGTGMWTQRLARYAERITVVDSSAEALARCSDRLAASPTAVRYIEADLFQWVPDRRYDVVCFAFWLSHVPQPRFDDFWALVEEALAPGGRFFFVDSGPPREDVPGLERRFAIRGSMIEGVDSVTDLERGISVRRVKDGREFHTIKLFWSPAELESRLTDLGWHAQVSGTDWAFIYGTGTKRAAGTR